MTDLTNESVGTATLTNATVSAVNLTDTPVGEATLLNVVPTAPSLDTNGYGVTWQEATFSWSTGGQWASYDDVISLTSV